MTVSSPPFFIFLSYSRDDSEFVSRLRADLQAKAIAFWIDKEGIQPGTPDWEDAIRQAIRTSQAVLLIASPYARSSRYVKDELRIAEMYNRPVYPLWIGGINWMEAVPLGWGGTQYIDARGSCYEAALQMIVTLQHEVPREQHQIVPAPSPVKVDILQRNPYKGLRAFTSADARDFFGREALVTEMTEALKAMLAKEQQNVEHARLLAVVGPSGSGKSSVVMAGLLPHLQQDRIPGSSQWLYLDPIVPGVHPVESLTLALSELLSEKSLKSIREDLEDEGARGLHMHALALTKLQKRPGSRVVLLVDQFEELFTLTALEAERRHFIDLLTTAATEPRGLVLVVLTLRADFYDRPMAYPLLSRIIQQHLVSVLPMEVRDLRAVIEQPARLPDVNVTFEGDLVGDLLFEMRGQIGALPLLEFTLDQLFERQRERHLTLQAYDEIGGVKGALTKHAEATYQALPSEQHRKLARTLFLRLIDPGATEQDTTRRRATLNEFVLSDAAQTALLQETMNAFITARLLTTNEIAHTTMVEVSHEALIREWPRLFDWIREARQDIPLQQAISEDTAAWEQSDKPSDRLYRGSQLKEAFAWTSRNVVSKKEDTFLQASRAYQVRSRLSLVALALLLILVTGFIVQFIVRESLPDPTKVTNLHDAGPGSLRQAIDLANPGSTITFSSNLRGPIQLKRNLNFGKSLTLLGPGADKLAISSGSRNFGIGIAIDTSVSFLGLAFSDSHIKGVSSNAFSSFISNSGTLTLINCRISGNSAQSPPGLGGVTGGGGIVNSGKLTLTNSIVSGNTAFGGPIMYGQGIGGYGGGISNSGTLILNNSIVSGNTAQEGRGATTGNNLGGGGGGISNSGRLILNNSVISDNTAGGGNSGASPFSGGSGGSGGGISNGSGPYPGDGTVILNNSIVSDNIAYGGRGTGSGGYGGGIASTDFSGLQTPHITLTNSTISGNIASGSAKDSGGSGGGIFNQSGDLTVINSTISKNQVTGGRLGDDRDNNGNPINGYAYNAQVSIGSGGGGIANSSSDNFTGSTTNNYLYGTLTLINSTIAGNTASTRGGGMINWGSKATVVFCTIYGNSAQKGGEIDTEISYAPNYYNGPGPVFKSFPGQVQVRNSIVVSDRTPGSAIEGSFTSEGYNLLQKGPGLTIADPDNMHRTDVIMDSATDVKIALQLSGKPPQLLALLVGSPAIDRIPLSACHPNGISADQRGVKRPQGTLCDIGAYEFIE